MFDVKRLNIELPDDKRFGQFFSALFLLAGLYFLFNESVILSSVFFFFSLLTFLAAYLNAKILRPFNVGWMFLGFVLGVIVSPLILGSIYIFLFSPVALLQKLLGRDELSLNGKSSYSYWQERSKTAGSLQAFDKQF